MERGKWFLRRNRFQKRSRKVATMRIIWKRSVKHRSLCPECPLVWMQGSNRLPTQFRLDHCSFTAHRQWVFQSLAQQWQLLYAIRGVKWDKKRRTIDNPAVTALFLVYRDLTILYSVCAHSTHFHQFESGHLKNFSSKLTGNHAVQLYEWVRTKMLCVATEFEQDWDEKSPITMQIQGRTGDVSYTLQNMRHSMNGVEDGGRSTKACPTKYRSKRLGKYSRPQCCLLLNSSITHLKWLYSWLMALFSPIQDCFTASKLLSPTMVPHTSYAM